MAIFHELMFVLGYYFFIFVVAGSVWCATITLIDGMAFVYKLQYFELKSVHRQCCHLDGYPQYHELQHLGIIV